MYPYKKKIEERVLKKEGKFYEAQKFKHEQVIQLTYKPLSILHVFICFCHMEITTVDHIQGMY